MITNLMDVYKIVNYGEEVTLTEVRTDEDGLPRIIRKTGYRYNGKTYKTGLDKGDGKPEHWKSILIEI